MKDNDHPNTQIRANTNSTKKFLFEILYGEYPSIITENILNIRPIKAFLFNFSFKNKYAQNDPNAR